MKTFLWMLFIHALGVLICLIWFYKGNYPRKDRHSIFEDGLQMTPAFLIIGWAAYLLFMIGKP